MSVGPYDWLYPVPWLVSCLLMFVLMYARRDRDGETRFSHLWYAVLITVPVLLVLQFFVQWLVEVLNQWD